MTTVIDSNIFGNVFSTPEIAAIWSDKQRTAYFLQFEAALAKAQAKLGIIPQKAAEEIVAHCRVEEIDFDELRRQTELIGYPVLPMVQQLVKKVNAVEERLGEWAHWGTTTQDLTDTAVVMQLRDTLELVEKVLDDITLALKSLCEKYRSTPMAARSNLQQAVSYDGGGPPRTHQLMIDYLNVGTNLIRLQDGSAARSVPTPQAPTRRVKTKTTGPAVQRRSRNISDDHLRIFVRCSR